MKNPTTRQMSDWHEAIEKHGLTTMGSKTFLRAFGVQRRTAAIQAEIQRRLRECECPGQKLAIYVDGLDATPADARVRLTHHDCGRTGKLWTGTESEFCREYEGAIMAALALEVVEPQHSPPGTKDRMDFFCRDRDGNAVVVEIKLRGGERRAVEQLLRYRGIVKEAGVTSIRAILVTGKADLDTRNALRGFEQDRLIEWYVYGLDEKRQLKLRPVNIEGA